VYIQNWLLGNVPHIQWTTIRTYLLKKENFKCSKCKWGQVNPVTKKSALTINHIDGNWKNNCPENLEALCPNCHALTPNYGALNKGRGRAFRKINRKTESSYGSIGS
jgi:5-methylcytosine-specific restriction endonuclease McrA